MLITKFYVIAKVPPVIKIALPLTRLQLQKRRMKGLCELVITARPSQHLCL